MADVRKGDVLDLGEMGVAEVLKAEANNEGGLDVTLRLADSRDELSRTILRKGGPDERDEDVDTHYEDYKDEGAVAKVDEAREAENAEAEDREPDYEGAVVADTDEDDEDDE